MRSRQLTRAHKVHLSVNDLNDIYQKIGAKHSDGMNTLQVRNHSVPPNRGLCNLEPSSDNLPLITSHSSAPVCPTSELSPQPPKEEPKRKKSLSSSAKESHRNEIDNDTFSVNPQPSRKSAILGEVDLNRQMENQNVTRTSSSKIHRELLRQRRPKIPVTTPAPTLPQNLKTLDFVPHCDICLEAILNVVAFNTLNRYYHPDCFCCTTCRTTLKPPRSFYAGNDGFPYCYVCFNQFTGRINLTVIDQ